jgi:predicted acylesterase/phospholipase RssA
MRPVRTFVSYAHADKERWARLRTHLAPLVLARELQIWDDRMIMPGSVWKSEIDKRLNEAELILLLVSPDFVASEYCYGIELQRAMERYGQGKAIVVPIILRPAMWEELVFGALQALPSGARSVDKWRAEAGYHNAAVGIRNLLKTIDVERPISGMAEVGLPSYILDLGASGRLSEKVIIEARHVSNAPEQQLTMVQKRRLELLKIAATQNFGTENFLHQWEASQLEASEPQAAAGEPEVDSSTLDTKDPLRVGSKLQPGAPGLEVKLLTLDAQASPRIFSEPEAVAAGPVVKLLTLDAGSIRVLFQLMILAEIEKRLAKPIPHLFQMIAGSGSGAIAAAALAMPDSSGKPLFSCRMLSEEFKRLTSQIFAARRRSSLWGFLGPRYSDKVLETALSQVFKHERLKNAVTDVLIPSYDIERRMPVLFSSRRARLIPLAYDFALSDCVRGAIANPFWFHPALLPATPERPRSVLIDGSLISANPAMTAYVDARRAYPNARRIVCVSLGSGQQSSSYEYEKAKSWGMIRWLAPVFDVTLTGTSELVHLQMREMLPDEGGCKSYFRFNPVLNHRPSLDDMTQDVFNRIELESESVLREHGDLIDLLVATLEPSTP